MFWKINIGFSSFVYGTPETISSWEDSSRTTFRLVQSRSFSTSETTLAIFSISAPQSSLRSDSFCSSASIFFSRSVLQESILASISFFDYANITWILSHRSVNDSTLLLCWSVCCLPIAFNEEDDEDVERVSGLFWLILSKNKGQTEESNQLAYNSEGDLT